MLANVATSGYFEHEHEHAGDQLCVVCSGSLAAKAEPEPPPQPAIVAQARPAPPPATRKIPSDLWRVVEEHPITAAQAIDGSTWAQAMSQWAANSSATPALLRHVLDALSRPQSVFALQKELARETERRYTKLSFSERLKLQLETIKTGTKP